MQGDPLIGRQLANYIIEREIGHGGMAVVYFGRDIRLNRPAAIKVIDARFRDQPNYTERFLQEARMVASWRHEHILQIYYADDAGFPDLGKVFFFAMEYIDGQNLADVLAESVKRHGKVPFTDVLRYGRAVAEALDYAHQKGVVHRDVKPANILISKDGRIVLSDFGLALDVQQGSIGEVFGSAHYIAPEQARRSADAVPQSDLYALGVILYEMLTGVVPFDDPSPTSVALQHITLPPPHPRDINPDLSEEIEAVLLKALAKKPADRFTSGRELIGALEDALARMQPSLPGRQPISMPAAAMQEKPSAGPTRPSKPSPLPVITRWKGKLGLAAAGIAVIGMLLIAVSFWAAQSALANHPTSTPSAAALFPTGQETELALSFTSIAPAVAPTATALLILPSAQPAATSADQPAPAAPTNTGQAAAQPTVTWTPKYASGRKMILSWNDSSFYMLQVTGYGELIDPLAFERLNAEGVPSNRFSGKAWAEYHSATLRDWCMRLEIGGPKQPASLSPFLRPAPCEQHYLATRYPAAGDTTIFWTRQEGSRQFSVLWGRDEIQRCEIDAGTCEVYLP